MKTNNIFPALLETFFTDRLIAQKCVSPNTVASYRDTFRLLLQFAHKRLKKQPCCLTLDALDASLICDFLDDIEKNRQNVARSRNLRLTAIRSFFKYVSFQEPSYTAHIQRILSIPSKKQQRKLIAFLTRPEINALLAVPDKKTWIGRRDHAFLMLAIQTGLRLSEMTNLKWKDIVLGNGAHARCHGKGRKERCTPLTKQTVKVMKAWLREQNGKSEDITFPSVRSGQLSSDAVQYLVSKHAKNAKLLCSSLKRKRVSPHVLRHTTAMELLQAGIDRSVIALWLGHESVETTQIYFDANLAIKEEILRKTMPINTKPGRYKADDKLLSFLKNL